MGPFMSHLIIGCGYLGSRVALRWQAEGHPVHVVTRSAHRAEHLRSQGLIAHVADVLRPDSLAALPPARIVLYAVARGRAADVPIRTLYVDGLRNVLAALDPPEKFIYISSTGVYGHAAAQWIDEDTPCRPQRPGGRACLQAERLLAAHRLASRAIVLRLAGIYGPGRLPRSADLQAGRPIDAPAEGYLNLIHVDDAADVVAAVAARIRPPRLYLVSDGRPVLRREYYEQLARLLAAPPPRFVPPPPDSPAAHRAAADKRISNARLVRDLQPAFRYPSFLQGLAAAVQSLHRRDPGC